MICPKTALKVSMAKVCKTCPKKCYDYAYNKMNANLLREERRYNN
jgi:hypothetical protein